MSYCLDRDASTCYSPCGFVHCGEGIEYDDCRRSVMTCNGIDPEEVDPDDEACGLDM